MKIGIFPGSFDPITNGHMDIIERAKNICDKIFVAIGLNSAKKPLFSVEERIEMIEKCCQFDDSIDDSNVEVTSFDGLLVDLCKDIRAPLIIRGIRAISDFEYEYAIALLNKKLAPETETVFLMSKGEYSFISSNMVREIASYHGDISSFVPPFVNNKLLEIFSQ